MKSERRHELEQNELADRLAHTIETIKPYQNAILGAVLLAVVCSVTVTWWLQKSATANETGWNEIYDILGEEPLQTAKLDTAIKEFAGTDLAHFAAISAGDRLLIQACDNLFESKSAAEGQLNSAAEYYRQVLDGSRSPDLVADAPGLVLDLVPSPWDRISCHHLNFVLYTHSYTPCWYARLDLN